MKRSTSRRRLSLLSLFILFYLASADASTTMSASSHPSHQSTSDIAASDVGKIFKRKFTDGTVVLFGPLIDQKVIMLIDAQANVYEMPWNVLQTQNDSVDFHISSAIKAPKHINEKWPQVVRNNFKGIWASRQNVLTMVDRSKPPAIVRFIISIGLQKNGSIPSLILNLDDKGNVKSLDTNIFYHLDDFPEGGGTWLSVDSRALFTFIYNDTEKTMHAFEFTIVTEWEILRNMTTYVFCSADGGQKVHLRVKPADKCTGVEWKSLRSGLILNGRVYLFMRTHVISFELAIFNDKTGTDYAVTQTSYDRLFGRPTPASDNVTETTTKPKVKLTTSSSSKLAIIIVVVLLVVALFIGIAWFCIRSQSEEKSKPKSKGNQDKSSKGKSKKKTSPSLPKLDKSEISKSVSFKVAKSKAKSSSQSGNLKKLVPSAIRHKMPVNSNFKGDSRSKVLSKMKATLSAPTSRKAKAASTASRLGGSGSSVANAASSVLSKQSQVVSRSMMGSRLGKSSATSSSSSKAGPDKSIISKITVKKSRK